MEGGEAFVSCSRRFCVGDGGGGGGEYEWFVVVRIEACVGLELAGCGLNVNST